MTSNTDKLEQRLSQIEGQLAGMVPAGSPPEDKKGSDGWEEWGLHVLAEIKRGNKEREEERERSDNRAKELQAEMVAMRKEMSDEMIRLHSEISALKVQAGVWGGVGGIVIVLGTLLVGLLR